MMFSQPAEQGKKAFHQARAERCASLISHMYMQTETIEIESLFAQIQYLEEQLSEANHELREVSHQLEQTETKLKEAQSDLLVAKTIISRAKDSSPVERPSFKRVTILVTNACMGLKKVAGGWLLFLGKLQRKFKSLKQIWLLLTQENWYLSDIFPPQASPPKFKDAPPRFPKRYPDLTKEIFDWQAWTPPDKPDEAPDCIAKNPFVEDDLPFAWSD